MAVSIEGRGPSVGSQYTVTLARQGIRQTGSLIFGKPSEMFLAVRPAHDMYKDMGRNFFLAAKICLTTLPILSTLLQSAPNSQSPKLL